MWEMFKTKGGDTAKESVFNLKKKNLIMLKQSCLI